MVAAVKHIDIELKGADELKSLDVHADVDMLKTVMRNLVSNAIKFSNPDSKVIVQIHKEEDMAVVSVKIVVVVLARKIKVSFCIRILILVHLVQIMKRVRDWACYYARTLL